jgi:hypothetical protein
MRPAKKFSDVKTLEARRGDKKPKNKSERKSFRKGPINKGKVDLVLVEIFDFSTVEIKNQNKGKCPL